MDVANTARLQHTSSGMLPLRVLHAIKTGLGTYMGTLSWSKLMWKCLKSALPRPPFEDGPPMGVLL